MIIHTLELISYIQRVRTKGGLADDVAGIRDLADLDRSLAGKSWEISDGERFLPQTWLK